MLEFSLFFFYLCPLRTRVKKFFWVFVRHQSKCQCQRRQQQIASFLLSSLLLLYVQSTFSPAFQPYIPNSCLIPRSTIRTCNLSPSLYSSIQNLRHSLINPFFTPYGPPFLALRSIVYLSTYLFLPLFTPHNYYLYPLSYHYHYLCIVLFSRNKNKLSQYSSLPLSFFSLFPVVFFLSFFFFSSFLFTIVIVFHVPLLFLHRHVYYTLYIQTN